ncbi:hypothetical protein ATO10_00490 [Actibacterium atlanticum]|uniref:Hedgehog/Intein (Hint) domain-containing protein n=2 Tax=Actibacterium atlanticum TaxID=1461693 RepID=A0A058ZNQ9_9RHOB|nr:hypothetical protein ATO10_00490 [Actibacterium atlanticum]
MVRALYQVHNLSLQEFRAKMTQAPKPNLRASYAAQVYPATELEVLSGVNHGDPMMPIDDLCLGDVYHLLEMAETQELSVSADDSAGGFLSAKGGHKVAEGSELGNPGDTLMLEGRLTFMAPDGDKVDLILIGHQPRGQDGRYLFFLPLDPIEPKLQYTLLTADPNPTEVRLADITPVAFTRGTLITLADGSQRAIENLAPGDKILTRDHGPQPVRWVGHRTVRAVGAHAPVVIPKGVLANESDLIVSQHQRLFIYRQGRRGLGETAEILVKARDLVDDDQVYIRGGGFVEYFHVVFDRHEIIYAEYIPTESLLINDASLGQLPEDMAREVAQTLPDTAHDPHYGTEADPDMVARLSPQDLRRRD